MVKLIRTALPLIEASIRRTSVFTKIPAAVTSVCAAVAEEALKNGDAWPARSVSDLRKRAKNALTEEEALRALVELFEVTLRDFEKNHPESRLTERFLL
ncbi:hypothetical protein EDD29_7470 [Actinocorallia herbida]|uniref:Uncharacterized protein n=1 Tax=Actinocorallia herbida TaxID=58109 RepID=A0A3N1D8A4_9ACTN|nr:hypothetical protein [Actinocorallia herbida]ROO89762.1 hypothetical protein EDD29_7470 [Actinocorallia herbida]